MELNKDFNNLQFPARVLRGVLELIGGLSNRRNEPEYWTLTVKGDEGTWTFDHLEEFFGSYAIGKDSIFSYSVTPKDVGGKIRFYMSTSSDGSYVTVESPRKSDILTIVNYLEESRDSATVLWQDRPPVDSESAGDQPSESNSDEGGIDELPEMRIFIGHGRSKDWVELKNHLQDKHEYKITAFETGERAGHAVRDVLEDMLDEASLAFLVLTGEDEQADGKLRARQNVIHETGLFQGRLGFSRAIILLEDGVEEFSNNAGIQHIPFAKGGIKSTFGDVLAVIRRESMTRVKTRLGSLPEVR